MEQWRKYLSEQDSSSKKIIFMAGGPGAGKSTILDAIGIDYPVVNADQFYEADLAAAGLTLDIESTFEELREARGNLRKEIYSVLEMEEGEESVKHDELMQLFAQAMDKGPTDELEKLKSKYDEKREISVQTGKIFADARKKSSSVLSDLINQGKSFVIDGTAGSLPQMINSKQKYEDMKYETAMIYVDTPLDVAIARQGFRKRRLPAQSVESSWNAVAKNKEPYEGLFADNFFYFMNDAGTEEEAQDKAATELKPQVDQFVGAVTEDFQADVKKGHSKMKRRIIGTGGNKTKAAPFDQDPSMERSKSSPPGFGGS